MRIVIVVPDAVFEAAEQLAHDLNVPRERLYAQALSAYVGSRDSAAITEKLDTVYGTQSSRIEPALARRFPDELRAGSTRADWRAGSRTAERSPSVLSRAAR